MSGGVPTPPVIVEAFADAASSTYLLNPIPVPSQIGITPGRASYTDGFPPLCFQPLGSGGFPIDGRDLNGILYALAANIAAITGGQLPTFSSAFSANNSGYAAGAIIEMAAGNGFWLNTVGGNTNNPDTATAATSGWVPLVAYGQTTINSLTGGALTLSAVQASLPVLILNGTLTSNLQISMPPWIKPTRIINNTTGAFTVTVQSTTGGASPRYIAPAFGAAGHTDVFGDGTDLQLQGYYAQGTFTGTLTGVTGTVTGTLNYAINGRSARVFSASATPLAGTSNSSSMTITGLPSFVAPPTITNPQLKPCAVQVASTPAAGATSLQITSGVALLFYISQVSGTLVDYNSAGFPTSGNKGVSDFDYEFPYF